jgi:hypothetical protein
MGTFPIARIVRAVVIGVVTGIVVLIVGVLLVSTAVPPAVAIGELLERFAWALGVLAGLWSFFGGQA